MRHPTAEEIIQKLQDVREKYFVKKSSEKFGLWWDEELARQGAQRYNILLDDYFTSKCHEAGYRIDMGGLHGGHYIKSSQPYVDSAVGLIETMIERVKEHGYDWDDYHPKLPPQPTRIEHWLIVNKNTFSLLKSFVPVVALLGFAVTGQFQNIEWPGATAAGIAILAIFFPELKDFLSRRH